MISKYPPRLGRLLAPLSLLTAVLLLAGCGLGQTVSTYWEGKDTSVRKRVAVAPFTSAVKGQEERAQALQKALAEALARQSGMALVPYAELEAAIAQVDPAIKDGEDRAMAAGRELGLAAIVAGNLVDLSIEYRLKGIYGFRDNTSFLGLEAEMKVFEPSSNTVAAQTSFRKEEVIDDIDAESFKNGRPAKPAVMEKLVSQLSKDCQDSVVSTINGLTWKGSVLAVEGDKVQVSAGTEAGFSTGDVLSVYAVGEKLRGGSGQTIILPGPQVGRLRLTQMGARVSWAEVLPQDGKKPALEPGQLLRIR